MILKEILMKALEEELNEKGFSEVYSQIVDCRICPIYGKCISENNNFRAEMGILKRKFCRDYIAQLITEEEHESID